MNRKIASTALMFLALALNGGAAHAFGNACRNVSFTVDNNFTANADDDAAIEQVAITVERVELWSQSEGRWLNEGIPDVTVPAGRQEFLIRAGETVEYAENDSITQMRVHFNYLVDGNSDAAPRRVHTSRTDSNIAVPKCTAGKTYHATINP